MELEDAWLFGLLGSGGELGAKGVDLKAVEAKLLAEDGNFREDCALLGLEEEGKERIVAGLERLFGRGLRLEGWLRLVEGSGWEIGVGVGLECWSLCRENGHRKAFI